MFTVLHFLLAAVGAGAKLSESSPRGVPVHPQPGQHGLMGLPSMETELEGT